jgi:hypothetical protein
VVRKIKDGFSIRINPTRFVNGKWVEVKMSKNKLAEYHKKMDKQDEAHRKKRNQLNIDICKAYEKYRPGSLVGVEDIQLLIRWHGGGVCFNRFSSKSGRNDVF